MPRPGIGRRVSPTSSAPYGPPLPCPRFWTVVSLGLHSYTPSPDTPSSKKALMSKRRLVALAAGVTVVAVASTTAWAVSSGGDASQTAASAALTSARQPGAQSPGTAPDGSTPSQSPVSGSATAAADQITSPSVRPSASPSAGPSAPHRAPAGPSTAAVPTRTGAPKAAPRKESTAAPKAEAVRDDAVTARKESAPKTDRTRTPKKVTSRPKTHVVSTGACGASYYAEGQMTASGERFNPGAMTAAHKTLPMGSRVRVTNPANGESVTVRINDRGPYVGGRCLDLSKAAFSAIGSIGAGVMRVKYEVLGT